MKRLKSQQHIKRTLLVNLPQWGALFAGFVLIFAIVVRPCANLMYISSLHLYSHISGSGDAVANSVVDAQNGCIGTAAISAIRHMDEFICPQHEMQGRTCRRKQDQVGDGIDYESIQVCDHAAHVFQNASKRLVNWFEPFRKNGTLTCAHTAWFNMTLSVPGVVTTTMFGEPVVLWYPSAMQHINEKCVKSKQNKCLSKSHTGKLSLVVYSHLSQKEELLTYQSIVDINHLSVTKGEQPPSVTMERKMTRLTGTVAHCVQWLMDVYQ